MTAAHDRAGILLVDDMEDNLVALEAVLSSLNQPLVRARSGEEAMKALLRQDFAVVLLDVLMPGMDGFETAANIKRLDQTKDIPIIFLTGNDRDTSFAFRGYATGAADYLTKPFDPWVLRAKVTVFLDLHHKTRQLERQAHQLRELLLRELPAYDPARLADIEERLAALERRLAADGRPDVAELARRVAELERSFRAEPGVEPAG
ncbi:response regulator [Streptomyces sp. NPDC006733]|uniref:response regulator n=1 Tax=Streptomyces sp. NPDC006733 TaxID=3155460 RepID=UPI0033EAB3CC